MTITTSKIISQTIQKDRSISVHERHTDNLGMTYDVVYFASPTDDLNITLESRSKQIETTLQDSDINDAIFTRKWDEPLLYSTKLQLGKKLRELYLQSEKHETVTIAKRIKEWLDNGRFSDTEIRSLFGLSSKKWITLKVKIGKLSEDDDRIEGAKGE